MNAKRWRTAWVMLLDLGGYAITVAVLAGAVALAVGIGTGGGLVRTKALLFLLGFVLMGYATVRLWPRTPDDVRRPGLAPRRGPDVIDRRVPPAAWAPAPPAERAPAPATKLFVASLLVLATSFVMEVGFGVA